MKDEVKQARRAKRVAEGHQLEIGAQRAPRFLVIIIIYVIHELLNIRQYLGRGLPAAIGLSTTPLSYECNPLPLEYNLINVIKCRFNEMPSSANNTIQYKGRGLLISSLMYHSAPAICRVPFFCNMMQKIFLSSISANRKTAGGENQ